MREFDVTKNAESATPLGGIQEIKFLDEYMSGKTLGDIYQYEQAFDVPIKLYNKDELAQKYPAYRDSPEKIDKMLKMQDDLYKFYVSRVFDPYDISKTTLLDISEITSDGKTEYKQKINWKEFMSPDPTYGYYDPWAFNVSGIIGAESGDYSASNHLFVLDKNGNPVPRQMANTLGNPLKRIQSPDQSTYYWMEAQDNEIINTDIIKGKVDRDLNSIWYQSYLKGLWRSTIPLIAKGTSAATASIANIGDMLVNNRWGEIDKERWWNKFNVETTNWANQQAVLNVDEQKGMFEDGNAFLLQFGDTIGQIGGVIATGIASGLIIKGLGIAGKTTGMLSLSPSIGESVSMQIGLTLGSFEAMGMMQDELTKMGFSEADIARTLPAFGVAAYLAENMFNANIVQRFGPRLVNNFYGTNIPKSSLIKGIVKEHGNIVKEGVENLSDKEKKNIINSMWTKLLQKRNQLKDITTESWKARYALSGVEEGVEEWAESFINMGTAAIFNGIQKNWAESFISADEQYEIRENKHLGNLPKSDLSYNIDINYPYVKVNKNNPNESVYISQEDYNIYKKQKELANNIMTGKSKIDASLTFEEAFMAAIGTWTTFLPVAKLGSNKIKYDVKELGYHAKDKPYLIGQYSDELHRMGREGKLIWSNKTDKKGNVVDYEQSEAAVNVENIVNEISYWSDVYQRFGLSTPEMKYFEATNKIYGLDKSIVKGAMEIAGSIDKINEAITKIDNKEAITEDPIIGIKKDSTKPELEALLKTKYDELDYWTKPKNFSVQGKNGTIKGKFSEKFTDQWRAMTAFDFEIDVLAEEYANSKIDKNIVPKSTKWYKEQEKLKKEFKKDYFVKENMLNLLETTYRIPIIMEMYKKDKTNSIMKDFLDNINNQVKQHNERVSTLKPESVLKIEKLTGVETMVNTVSQLIKEGKEIPFELDLEKTVGLLDSAMREIQSYTGQALESVKEQYKFLDKGFEQKLIEIENAIGETDEQLQKQIQETRKLFNNPLERTYQNVNEFSPKQREKIINDAYIAAFNNGIITIPSLNRDITIKQIIEDNKNFVDGNAETFMDPDVAKFLSNILPQIQEHLYVYDNWLRYNVDYFQDRVEKDDNTKEHSALLREGVADARLTKEQVSILRKQLGETNTLIDKILDVAKLSIKDIESDNVQSRIRTIDIRNGILNDLHYAIVDGSLDVSDNNKFKEVFGQLRKHIATREKDEEKYYLSNVWKEYYGLDKSNEELAKTRSEIESYLDKMESYQIQLYDMLGGKLTKHIENLHKEMTVREWSQPDKKGTNDLDSGYSDNTDFIKDIPIIRNNKELIEGSYSRATFEDGKRIKNQKGSDIYWFILITELMIANRFGVNDNIKYSEAYQVTRDIFKQRAKEPIKDGHYVSTYEQQQLLIHALSFYLNPKDTLVTRSSRVATPLDRWDNGLRYSLYVRGYAGTGKSTQFLKDLSEALNLINPDNKLKTLIVLPTHKLENQYRDVQKIIADTLENGSFDIRFTDEINTINFENYNMIVFDECTMHTFNQKKIIGDTLNKINETKTVRTFLLGDDAQPNVISTVKTEQGMRLDLYNATTWFNNSERTVPITNVFRSGYIIHSRLQEKLRAFKHSSNPFILPDYGYVTDSLGDKHGIETYPTVNEVIDKFKEFIRKKGKNLTDDDAILVVRNKQEYDEVTKDKDIDEKHVKYFYPSFTDLDRSKLISGSSSYNVFVAFNMNDIPSKGFVDQDYYNSLNDEGKQKYLESLENLLENNMRANEFKSRYILGAVTRVKTGINKEGGYLVLVSDVKQTPANNLSTYKTSISSKKEEFNKEIDRIDNIVGKDSTYNKKDVVIDGLLSYSLTRESEKNVIEITKKEVERLSIKADPELKTISQVFDDTLKPDETHIQNTALRYAVKWKLLAFKYGEESEQSIKVADEAIARLEEMGAENPAKMFTYWIETAMLIPSFYESIDPQSELTVISPSLETKNKSRIDPLVIKIVGYTNIEGKNIPIIDIYELNNTTKSGSASVKNDILERRLGAYMSILGNSGYLINNVNILNYTIRLSKEKKHDITRQEIYTLSPEERLAMIKKANDILTGKHYELKSVQLTTKKEYFNNERSTPDILKDVNNPESSKSIKLEDIFGNDKNELVSIVDVTTVISGDTFKNYIYVLNQKEEIQKYDYDEFIKIFHKKDFRYNENFFIETAQIDNSRDNPGLYSTSSVFFYNAYTQEERDINRKEFFNTETNKVLRIRQFVTGFIAETPNIQLVKRYYYKDKRFYDVETHIPLNDDHIVVNELEDDAVIQSIIDAMVKEKIITGKELNIADFKNKGFNIISMDSKPEYDFKTADKKAAVSVFDNKSISKDVQDYIDSVDENEALLDKIFKDAFSKDPSQEKRDLLISTNKKRLRTIRRLRNKEKTIPQRITRTRSGNIVKPYSTKTMSYEELVERGKKNGFTLGEPTKVKKGNGIVKFFVPVYRQGLIPTMIEMDAAEIKKSDLAKYMDELLDDLKLVKDKVKDKNISEDYLDAVSLVDTSLAMSFIRKNQNAFAETATKVKDIYSDKMYMKNGYIQVNTFNIDKRKIDVYLINLEQIIKDIKENGNKRKEKYYYTPFLSSKKEINKKRLSIFGEDISQGIIYTHEIGEQQNTSQDNEGYEDHTKFSGFHIDKQMNYDPYEYDLIGIDEVRSQLNSILGNEITKKYLNEEDLVFVNRVIRNLEGRRVFGMLDRSLLRFSTFNGKVEKYTPRHEAMHFIMLMMLPRLDRTLALRDAKKMMVMENKYKSVKDITDKEAHEYIADIFEDGTYKNKTYPEKSLLQRFLDFLAKFIPLFRKHRTSLYSILTAADEGKFVDGKVYSVNNQEFGKTMKEKSSRELTDEYLATIFGTRNVDDIRLNMIHNYIMPVMHEYFSPYSFVFEKLKTGRNVEEMIMNTHKYFYALRNELSKEIVSYYSEAGVESERGTIDMFTSEDFNKAMNYFYSSKVPLNQTFLDIYVKYHITDIVEARQEINVFKSLVEEAFGNYRRGKGFKDATSEGGDTNYFDSQSQMQKHLLSMINLYEDRGTKGNPKWVRTNRRIDSTKLHILLLETAKRVPSYYKTNYLNEDKTDWYLSFNGDKFSVKRWVEVIDSFINTMQKGRDRNMLYSFRNYLMGSNEYVDKDTATFKGTKKDVINRLSKKFTYSDIRTLNDIGLLPIINDFRHKNSPGGGVIYDALTGNDSPFIEYRMNQEEYAERIRFLQAALASFSVFYNSTDERFIKIFDLGTGWSKDKEVFQTNKVTTIRKTNIKDLIAERVLSRNDHSVNKNTKNLLSQYSFVKVKAVKKKTAEEYDYYKLVDKDGNDILTLRYYSNTNKTYSNNEAAYAETKNLLEMMGIYIDTESIKKIDYIIPDTFRMIMSLKINELITPIILNEGEEYINRLNAATSEAKREKIRKELIAKYDKATDGMYTYLANTYVSEYKRKFKPESYSKDIPWILSQPTPLEFWHTIERIINVIKYNGIHMSNIVGRDIKGNLNYAYVAGSFITDTLVNPYYEESMSMTDILIDRMQKEIGDIDTPLRINGKWNNPILSRIIGAKYRYYNGGMSLLDNGEKFADLVMHDKWTLLIKSLMFNIDRDRQLFPIWLDPFADKRAAMQFDMQYINEKNELDDVLLESDYKEFKGKRMYHKFNFRLDRLLPAIYQLKRYYEEVQKKHLERWNAIAGNVEEVSTKVNPELAFKITWNLYQNSEWREEVRNGERFIVKGTEITFIEPYSGIKNPFFGLEFTDIPDSNLPEKQYQEALKRRIDDVYKAFNEVLETNNQAFLMSGYDDLPIDMFGDFYFTMGQTQEELSEGNEETYNIGVLTNERFKLQNKEDELTDEEKERISEINKLINRGYTKLKEQGFKHNGRYHPLIETLFWTNFLFGESLNPMIRGTQFTYEDYVGYVKRGSGPVAPGTKYDTEYMGKTSRAIFVKDILVNDPLFQRQISNEELKPLKATDGMILMNFIYNERLRRAHGDIISNVGLGSLKNVGFDINYEDGNIAYLKTNFFPISYSAYKNDPFIRSAIRMMWGKGETGRTLDNMFSDLIKKKEKEKEKRPNIDVWSEAMNDMIYFLDYSKLGVEASKGMVDFIVFETSSKANNHKVIELNKDEATGLYQFNSEDNNEENIHYIKNDSIRLQVETLQDVVDNETSYPRQEFGTIVALPQNRDIAIDVENILSDSLSSSVSELQQTAKKDGTLKKWINSRLLSKEKHSQDPMKIGKIIRGKNVTPFVWWTKAMNAVFDEYNDSVKPDLPGAFHVQSMGTPRIIWRDGKPYLLEDVNTIFEDNNPQSFSELKPIGYVDENNNPYTNFYTLENDIKAEKNVTYVPADVIAPFAGRERFGLSVDTTLAQALTVTKIKDNTKEYLYETYNDRKDMLYYVNLFTENKYILHKEVAAKIESNLKAVIKGITSEKEINRLRILETAKYFKEFNDALDVFFVRIPTTSPSMGAIGRIVAFDNGVANTFYVSAKKNILDGSDWDADQLNVIQRGTTPEEVALFELLVRFYNRPSNYRMVLSRIDIEPLRQKFRDLNKRYPLYNNAIGSNILMSDIVADGTIVIGHFVNMSTYFHKLMSLDEKTRKSLPTDMFTNEEKFYEMIGIVEILVNAATDNVKEGGLLGFLNMNEYTSPIISGVLFYGHTDLDKLNLSIYNEMKEYLSGKKMTDKKKKQYREQMNEKYSYNPVVSRLINETDLSVKPDYIYTDLLDKLISILNSRDINFAKSKVVENNKLEEIYKYKINSYLNDPQLLKYYHAGENLRRVGSTISLIKGFKSYFDFIRKSNMTEMNLAMDLETFSKTAKEPELEDQLNYLRKRRTGDFFTEAELAEMSEEYEKKIQKKIKNDNARFINKEKAIRSSFSLFDIVKASPVLNGYVQAMYEIKNLLNGEKEVSMFNDTLKEIFNIVKDDRIFNEKVYKELENGYLDFLVGSFINDTYKEHVYESDFMKENGMGNKFNMANLIQRTYFFISFEKYLNQLREEYPENRFLNSLTLRGFRDYNKVELFGAMYMNKGQLTDIYSGYAELPVKVQADFELYALIAYGIKDHKDSWLKITGSTVYERFSSWLSTKDINPKIAANEILIKTGKLVPFDSGEEVHKKAKILRYNNSIKKEPLLKRVLPDGTTEIISNPYFSGMNSYTGDNTIKEGRIESLTFTLEEMIEFAKNGRVIKPMPQHMVVYKATHKEEFGKVQNTKQVLQTGENVFANFIESEDGTVESVLYSLKKETPVRKKDKDDGEEKKNDCNG